MSSCLAQVNTIRGKVSSRAARGARPGAIRLGVLGRIRRLIRSVPPKVAIVVLTIASLVFLTVAYHAPEFVFKFRTRHYQAAEVHSLSVTSFPPDRETLNVLTRALPQRSGKVMILRTALSPQVMGRSRPARIDDAWARLPARLRAESLREVDTLVSVFALGGTFEITIYDLPSRRVLGRYDVDGYPKFSFGQTTLDIVEFVERMPFGRPAPIRPRPGVLVLPPKKPEPDKNLLPESGE